MTSRLSPWIYFVTQLCVGIHAAWNTKWYMFLITRILSAVGLHTWKSAAEPRLCLSVKFTMNLKRIREIVRATISFVRPSVCSHGTTRLARYGFFLNSKFERGFEILSRKFKVGYNLRRITGTLQEYLCQLTIISRWVLLKMRRYVEKIEIHFLCSVSPPCARK
jgi:hypothetical protein